MTSANGAVIAALARERVRTWCMGESPERTPFAFYGNPPAMQSRADEPRMHCCLVAGIDGQIAGSPFPNFRVSVVPQDCQDMNVLNEKSAAREHPPMAIAFCT